MSKQYESQPSITAESLLEEVKIRHLVGPGHRAQEGREWRAYDLFMKIAPLTPS